MSHPRLLRFQVKSIIRRCLHLNRHALLDFHAKIRKLIYLIRVIGQKTQRLDSQIL